MSFSPVSASPLKSSPTFKKTKRTHRRAKLAMMWRLLLAPLLILLLITLPPAIAEEAESATVAEAAEITTEGEAASGNSTEAKGENTFADMIDRALQKEFTETEQTGAGAYARYRSNSCFVWFRYPSIFIALVVDPSPVLSLIPLLHFFLFEFCLFDEIASYASHFSICLQKRISPLYW